MDIKIDGGLTMENNVEKYGHMAEVLKALGHPVRLCIIRGLVDTKGCNVNHMTDCLQLPQSTVSQHLQKLKSSGIIEGKRNGTEITYFVKDELVNQIIELITTQEEK